MLAIRRTFFGEMPAAFEGHITPIKAIDKIALVLLAGLMIGLGMFPSIMVPMVATGVENVLRILGGA
jgi:NADH:ubiquinone oxidoreductase subunit 4 (subunit M)